MILGVLILVERTRVQSHRIFPAQCRHACLFVFDMLQMRAGWAIGVPLTILQWSIHQTTPGLVDPASALNNVLVSGAIYGADRIGVTPATQLAMVGSTCFYASDPATIPIAPCVPVLHYGYASVLKPRLAPVKPFFVSFCWTLAIYYVPLLRAQAPVDELLLPASLFLSIASLSHAVDVIDRFDDARDGIATPAVRLGSNEATAYAIALWATSVFLHGTSPQPNACYDALVLLTIGIAVKRDCPYASVVTSGVVFAGAYAWRRELIRGLLESSATPHSMAMSTFLQLERAVNSYPDAPWRKPVLDALFTVFNTADDIGHLLLVTCEHISRQ